MVKKICPYCGRVDELGKSCQGCGYVLQESDKTVPRPEPLPKSAPKPQNPVGQKVIPNGTDWNAAASRKNRSIFTRLLGMVCLLFYWMAAVWCLIIGLLGIFALPSFFEGGTKMGIISILIIIFFLLMFLALLCKISRRSLKVSFGKYIKYLFILDLIFFILTAFLA